MGDYPSCRCLNPPARAALEYPGFDPRGRGYVRRMHTQMQPEEPVIRFDDNVVEVAAQLVPQLGYEEAERIFEASARTHRPVDAVVADAA